MVEVKLAELKTQLSSVVTEKGNLMSTISSKSSSYLNELETMNRDRLRQQANGASQTGIERSTTERFPLAANIFSSTFLSRSPASEPTEDLETELNELEIQDEEQKETETFEREIDAFKDLRELALRDSQALVEGSNIWKSVCLELNMLEQSIISMFSGARHNSQKDQVSELEKVLLGSISRLEGFLEIASKQKWGLLIVAISHELEALYQSQQMIESGSDRQLQKNMAKDYNGSSQFRRSQLIQSDNEEDGTNA